MHRKQHVLRSPKTQFEPKKMEDGHHALSFAQERLWFLDQLEDIGSAYNIVRACRLKGPLDKEALEKSLQAIVARHDVFRTVFRLQNEIPVQVVESNRTIELEQLDLRGESDEAVQRLISKEAEHPFDLSRDLMLRAKLLGLSDEENVLLLIIHHIASDGWSMGILYREVSEFYSAYIAGRQPDLPELPIQYIDYAVSQREWLQGEKLEDQLCYWKTQLAGIPPLLEIPTDYPRPSHQTFKGAGVDFVLSKDLTKALNFMAKREGCTLFMLLLAAFQTLLYRYTGQDDIVVGTPIAGRTQRDTEGLIGFFVNTLALRTDLSGEPTFRELIGRVCKVALGAYSNQEIPFEKLVAELNPERRLNHSPMFQVMLAFQNMHSETLALPGLKSEGFRPPNTSSRFDLILFLKPKEQTLEGHLEYSTDLFNESSIHRMVGHLEVLLQAVLNDPEQSIASLPVLTDGEKRQLLTQWNDSSRDYPRDTCAHHLFEIQASRTPDTEALLLEKKCLTYRELNEQANQVAHYLQQVGVGPEIPVGICVKRSLEMLVGILGILKAGGVYVPLDPTFPKERLAFMLEDTAASVLLTSKPLTEKLAPNGIHVVCLDTDWETIAKEGNENPTSKVSVDNLAYILYTSGSTGLPKGVMMPHASLVNLISWQRAYSNNIREGTRTLQYAPFGFDVSFQEIFSTWSTGGTLIMLNEDQHRDPVETLRLIGKMRIERLFMPFVALEQLAEAADRVGLIPKSLREVNTAGEQLRITPKIHQLFEQIPDCKLINQYGPTETHVVSAFELREKPGRWPHFPPIGRPIANTRLYILDGALEPVPIGIPGELYIGGAGLARGYLNRPNLTNERFVSDPFDDAPEARLYKTGDLVRYLADGNIVFLGRMDGQVKIRGYRIELGEIEVVLSKHPAVDQCVVAVREDTPGDRHLAAYVVGDQEKTSTSELREFLKGKLPDYMIPAAIMMVEHLPLTPNGKVDYRALPKPSSEDRAAEDGFKDPETPIEETLVGIWQELFGLERISTSDNFFELGGHSLLATRMISRVHDRLRVELPMRTLFDDPTIKGLSNHIHMSQG